MSAYNNGEKHYLWLYEIDNATGQRTGRRKLNVPSDPDYIAPIQDPVSCPLPIITWTPINPFCILDANQNNTGMQGFAQRARAVNGVVDGFVEDNIQDGKYIAPIQNLNECPTAATAFDAFDYVVVRYMWSEDGGRDLDTFTGFIDTNTIYDRDWVGYNQGGSKVPSEALEPYLQWASDNTQSGVEAVLINFKKFTQDHPELVEDIKVQLAAVWWSQKLSGSITVELATYIGGSMVLNQANYNFENQGGALVQQASVSRTVNAFNTTSNISNADVVGLITYNATTKQATLT